jgi:hypothetical protein
MIASHSSCSMASLAAARKGIMLEISELMKILGFMA